MQHSKDIQTLYASFETEKTKILEDYFSFLRFKSVSTEANYQQDILKCANWLEDFLKNCQFDVQRWETKGHPVIFGQHCHAGPEQPTLLIYNHYDVQPVDPLELWLSDPFEPEIKQDKVYARGAQDNKGQCLYTLWALRAILEKQQKLPINVKICIEGEEECGSYGLAEILKDKKDLLKADYLAIVDLGIQAPNQPSLSLGIRGIVSLDVILKDAKMDLHSGCHGGILYNPNHALVEMLATLRDAKGRIQVDGFYEDMEELSEDELRSIDFHFDAIAYEKRFGAKAIGGEKELKTLESNWLRPTLEINGIGGGYTGKGFKTVIPCQAIAKISCRLAKGQNPEKIANLVKKHLEKQVPNSMTLKVHIHKGGRALQTSPKSPLIQAASLAYEKVFLKKCHFNLEGASIPIASALAHTSGAEVLLMGLGLEDDHIHAPNERFSIQRLKQGFAIVSSLLEGLRR